LPTAHLDGDMTALVVRSICTDLFAARTQARDGNLNPQHEVRSGITGIPDEPTLIVHQGRRTAGRRRSAHEIRKPHLNSGTLRVEASPQLSQQRGHRAHRKFASVSLEHLNETTHVRALEVVTQTNR